MSLVIPIFIPHEGCPHQCLFCNQQSITGEKQSDGLENKAIDKTIRQWLGWTTGKSQVQVAFYGGSFSCLSEGRQKQLFSAVAPYLVSGAVDSIRISTRPDCISETICTRLHENGVRTVELGCQSMDDHVLETSKRGHTAQQSMIAAELLLKKGLELGIQLMPGLPGETTRSFLSGISDVIRLRPAFVRLYPAVVVEKTQMAKMYERGEYIPLSMNRAVALTCLAYERFQKVGIRVIRMGLQPSASLEKTIIAGPYHPSFGELVLARTWFKRTRKVLCGCLAGETVEIKLSDKDLSTFIGPKRINMKRLEQLGLKERLTVKTEKKMERGTMQYAVG